MALLPSTQYTVTQSPVLIPDSFFRELTPFNMELLKGNSAALRAVGAKMGDGSIIRSKGYLLFEHGLATEILKVSLDQENPPPLRGRVYSFTKVRSETDIIFWRVNGTSSVEFSWTLGLSTTPPDPDDGIHVVLLAHVNGCPAQYLYLYRTA